MILPKYIHKKNQKIIDRYGTDLQIRQLMEECAEVIQKANKYLRAKEEHGKAEVHQAEADLKTEIADVTVLFDQLMPRIGMTKEELYQIAAYKIDRQLGRMKK